MKIPSTFKDVLEEVMDPVSTLFDHISKRL